MRRRRLLGPAVDVWPAFTDFLTSVSFLLVALLLATPWYFSVEALMPRGDQEDPLKEIKKAQQQIRTVLVRDLGLKPDQIHAGLTDQRIIFFEGALFDSNSAVLKTQVDRPGARPFRSPVERLADTLDDHLSLIERIEVEGHTDNVPFRGAGSNWELSAQRAAAVVEVLQSRGIPAYKVSAKGYSKYHPVGARVSGERDRTGEFAYIARANRTEGQKARNRRIEILLVYSDPGTTPTSRPGATR